MPLRFPVDHVLNRLLRLTHEIRITRSLRDAHFVQVQILQTELEDLAQRTPPYQSVENEYWHKYYSETKSLSDLLEIATALYHWHEMHVRHCRDEREHLQACLHNPLFRLQMYGP